MIAGTDGRLYGVTPNGGTGSAGILYSMDTNGTNFQVLHPFDYSAATLGTTPYSRLLDIGGMLYGTTNGGGTHNSRHDLHHR